MDNLITAGKEILRFVLRTGCKWTANKLSDQEYLQEHAKFITDTIEPQLDKISKQIQEQHDVKLKTALTDYAQALVTLKATDPRKVRTRGAETTDPESKTSLPQEVAELLRESFQNAIQAFHAKKNLSVKKRIQAMQIAMACIALLHDHEPNIVAERWQQLIGEFFNDEDILRVLLANLEYSTSRRYLVRGNKNDLKCLEAMATDVFSQLEVMKGECCPGQQTSITTAMKSLARPPTKMSEKGYSCWIQKLTTRAYRLETEFSYFKYGNYIVWPTDDGSVILLGTNKEDKLLLFKLDQHLNEVYRRVIDAHPLSGITVKGSVVYALLEDDAIHGFDHERHFAEVDETIPLQSIMAQDEYDDYVNRRLSYQMMPVATKHGHMVLAVKSKKPRCLQVYITSLRQPCRGESVLIQKPKDAIIWTFCAHSVSQTDVRIGLSTDNYKVHLMTATKTDSGWSVGLESTSTFDHYDLCTFDKTGRFLMMKMTKNEFAFLKLDGSEDEQKLHKHKLYRSNNRLICGFAVKRDTMWFVNYKRSIERHHFVDLIEGAIDN